MKKKGKMAACLILLVLLLAVLVVLTKKNSTADADSGSSNSGADAEKVVDFSKDDVTALSFQIDGETVSFTKTAGDDDTDIWTYDQEDGFPLDEGKITNVLSSLSSMTAERVIEGDEIDSMADFGLETPSQEVVVTAGDEKTTIHVGDKNSSSRYYIYLNDDTSKVYLVSTSLGTMFPSDMMEWATTESMPSVTAENITKLQVEGENGYTLTKEVSAADSALQTDEWQVVDADGAAHGGDADSIGTMTSAVASLSFGDLVTYNASDLSQYGLDQPKTTIRVHYTEEQEVASDDATTADTSSDSAADSASSDSTATSSSSETTTVTVEKDLVLYVGNANEDGGSYYVKLDGSNEVHLMTASNVETFTGKKASDFWNMYIGMENVSDLTSLDITYNGETKTYVPADTGRTACRFPRAYRRGKGAVFLCGRPCKSAPHTGGCGKPQGSAYVLHAPAETAGKRQAAGNSAGRTGTGAVLRLLLRQRTGGYCAADSRDRDHGAVFQPDPH